MANTLYLNDGSMEVIIGDPADCLKRLIGERLGRDAENLFSELLDERQAQIEAQAEFAKDFELNADGYLELCRDACDSFQTAINMVKNCDRLNRKRLIQILERGYTQLNNNL